jgi:hypothetical protein
MTDFDTIEQRLRATFQAVAEQPIVPVGVDDEPWHNDVATAPTHRRPRVLLGAVAGVVVIALVALGVAYGPRSATNTTSPPPSSPYAHVMHAVFAPVSPTSHAELDLAAATMTVRLRSLGDHHDTVTVRGRSIDVSGPSISQSQLLSVAAPGAFSVRPVLCGAPAYLPIQPNIGGKDTGGALPACDAPYALSASNLDVNTNTGVTNPIPADPSFARVPSTPAQSDEPAAAVLLPADPSTGAQEYPRFVLGAAQLGGSDIASASAESLEPGVGNQWSVVITLKPSAATAWDAMAQANFHQFVAFDLDGQVLAAPLIQPTQTSFSSFRGQIEMAYYSAAEAKSLAAVLGSGPLAPALNLESVSRAAVL